MKKKLLILVIGFLFIGVELFAADGDLIVNGNLTVGTTNPFTKLHVAYPYAKADTTEREALTVSSNDAGNPFKLVISVTGNASLANRTVSVNTGDHCVGYGGNIVLQAYAGNVGIGINPSYRLHLASDSAAKPSTSTWTVASDARLKTNIRPYTKGLSEILQISPVNYQYNGKGGIGHGKTKKKDPVTDEEVEIEVVDTELLLKTHVGVLAQDVQAVIPEAVTSHKGRLNKDDAVETELLDFNSHSLTFILINAVKELKAEIDSLNKQLADLKGGVK
jgi:hypothetical protein